MSYYAVFDTGGSSIKYALMDEMATFLKKGSVKTPMEGIDSFVETIAQIVEQFQETYSIEGVALSMPGAVDVETGYIGGGSKIPYIHGPNIKQLVQKRTGVGVELENDANCAGLAEGWMGAAQDVNDYICIVIGSGIGGTIVLDKKVRHGKNLHAGEFGYMLMEGYLEHHLGKNWSQVASTAGLVRHVANRKGKDCSDLDGKTVFEMADYGDADAQEEISTFIKRLAVGIFNVQYVIDPEKILIGGAVSKQKFLIERINQELSMMKDDTSRLHVTVERCAFGNDSNLIGALYHYLQQKNMV
ncbi:ROK family protein [Peribacillus muralis]|uniref:ROK family protein n=1 Tax=Peribacillus muralis TaxID=264697 RepID=UPI00070EA30B|nr:ROK family protein [Peribacillus muralis]